MFASEVARKYANALFLSVKERDLVDEAYEQFRVFRSVAETDRSLLSILAGPSISADEKIGLVKRVFGEQLHRLHVEFLTVLIRKRRISFLPGIIDELERLIEDEKGIIRASVTAAVEITPTEEEELIRQLHSRTGNTILLEKRVDPSVVGGAIVMLRNEIIDGSVRHGLDLLEDRLAKLRVY